MTLLDLFIRALKVIAYSLVVLAVLLFIYIVLIVIDIRLTKRNCREKGYEFGVKYVKKKLKVYSYGCAGLAISYLDLYLYFDTINKENYHSVFLIDMYEDSLVSVADGSYTIGLDTLLDIYQPELIEVHLSAVVCARGGIGVWPLRCTDYRCTRYIDFTSDSVMLCKEIKKAYIQ